MKSQVIVVSDQSHTILYWLIVCVTAETTIITHMCYSSLRCVSRHGSVENLYSESNIGSSDKKIFSVSYNLSLAYINSKVILQQYLNLLWITWKNTCCLETHCQKILYIFSLLSQNSSLYWGGQDLLRDVGIGCF